MNASFLLYIYSMENIKNPLFSALCHQLSILLFLAASSCAVEEPRLRSSSVNEDDAMTYCHAIKEHHFPQPFLSSFNISIRHPSTQHPHTFHSFFSDHNSHIHNFIQFTWVGNDFGAGRCSAI
jgi:hypothetical protein